MAARWASIRPVNLEGVTVGQLDDDWSSERPNGYWPTGGRLRLDGFTYGRFGGKQRVTAEQRVAWIRSQYQPPAGDIMADFATQPYEHLAAVYRQTGQDTEARKIAIARRADLRKYGNLNPYRRFGNWFLDWSIRYGYQTWRAGVRLAAVFLVFVVLSFVAQQHHLMVPVGDTDGLHFLPSATKCTSDYPCFYAVGYAVNTVIPILNVHQAENWGPYGQVAWGRPWVAGTWIATGLGWALATLLVAGYTGLVRPGLTPVSGGRGQVLSAVEHIRAWGALISAGLVSRAARMNILKLFHVVPGPQWDGSLQPPAPEIAPKNPCHLPVTGRESSALSGRSTAVDV